MIPLSCLRPRASAVLLAFVAPFAGAAADAPRFGDATPMEWSRRMADSEMARRGNTMFFEGAARARGASH